MYENRTTKPVETALRRGKGMGRKMEGESI
jgi:hypothetical protein